MSDCNTYTESKHVSFCSMTSVKYLGDNNNTGKIKLKTHKNEMTGDKGNLRPVMIEVF